MKRLPLILAIIGIIIFSGVLFIFIAGYERSDPSYSRPHAELAALEVALESYHYDFGAYPPKETIVESLTGSNSNYKVYFEIPKNMLNKKNQLVDPWGTPYQIDFSAKYPILISAGPDRDFNRIQDNISNQ